MNQSSTGRYVLLYRLGHSDFTEVYRGMAISDSNTEGRPVIVKSFPNGADVSEVLRPTLGLRHHGIVNALEVGSESGRPFVVFEDFEARSLALALERTEQRKAMIPVSISLHIIARIAEGLGYAHRQGIHHGGLNPESVLIGAVGTVKISDFGLSSCAGEGSSAKDHGFKARPVYASPEQVAGKGASEKGDVFILGALLWQVLTGKPLFCGRDRTSTLLAVIDPDTVIRAPSGYNADVSPALDKIVLRALERDPRRRQASMDELLDQLNGLPCASSSQVSSWIRDLFQTEIGNLAPGPAIDLTGFIQHRDEETQDEIRPDIQEDLVEQIHMEIEREREITQEIVLEREMPKNWGEFTIELVR